MAVFFISIGPIPCMVPTIDNADPLFALVIKQDFYLHPVEVADHETASGSL